MDHLLDALDFFLCLELDGDGGVLASVQGALGVVVRAARDGGLDELAQLVIFGAVLDVRRQGECRQAQEDGQADVEGRPAHGCG